MKTRLTPPEIRDYRAHTREETLPARSLQQHVRKKLAQHAIKRLFSAIFRSLGELFRAHARIKASQGEFAHRTQRPGDAETNTTTAHPQHGTTEPAITSAHPQQGTTETAITSAPKNRTKNAHFSPAKAMAVSNHRASSPAAPTRSARGRRRDPISTHSHAIPPTHTSRLDTQSLKFHAIHRATNHRRQGIACETEDRAHFEAARLAGQRADAPNHPSARQAPQVWRAPEARLRRPWAAAGPGQATHRHPRPIGDRREACGAWPGFETTHRAKLAARTASGRAGRAAAGDLSGQQAARPHAAPHAHGAPAPHANGWGTSRHPTRQRPSFNKRSLCRQRLRRADLGGPAARQPRRDQRGHDGHDAHADQL